jgi:protoheme IX farnesyltransferase
MTLVVFTGLVGLLVAPGATIHPVLGVDRDPLHRPRRRRRRRDQHVVRPRHRCADAPHGAPPDPGRAHRAERGPRLRRWCSAPPAVVGDGAGDQLVAAAWLAFSILFYVVVYTVWLKRRTRRTSSSAAPPAPSRR